MADNTEATTAAERVHPEDMAAFMGEIRERMEDITLDRRENETVQLATAVLLNLTRNMANRGYLEYLMGEACEDQTTEEQLAGMSFDQADAFYAVVDKRRAEMKLHADVRGPE